MPMQTLMLIPTPSNVNTDTKHISMLLLIPRLMPMSMLVPMLLHMLMLMLMLIQHINTDTNANTKADADTKCYGPSANSESAN